MIMGCLAGFSSSKDLKQGEQAERTILCAFVVCPEKKKDPFYRHSFNPPKKTDKKALFWHGHTFRTSYLAFGIAMLSGQLKKHLALLCFSDNLKSIWYCYPYEDGNAFRTTFRAFGIAMLFGQLKKHLVLPCSSDNLKGIQYGDTKLISLGLHILHVNLEQFCIFINTLVLSVDKMEILSSILAKHAYDQSFWSNFIMKTRKTKNFFILFQNLN